MCHPCWIDETPDREPYRVIGDANQLETCAVCGAPTRSGIYVRRHPSRVQFPARDDDE